MPSNKVNRAINFGSRRLPGVKRLPVMRMLALGEVALMAYQEHLALLEPHERRRLLELVRTGRGRRRNLTESEREELHELMVKLHPREFAAHAAQKLSPVPIPKTFVRRVGRD
jgi:hypothetical protein